MSRSFQKHESRTLNRRNWALEASLGAFKSPAPTSTEIVRPNPALLGTKEERDAFADMMLRREIEYQEAMADLPDNTPTPEDINRMAAIHDELRTEGRIHVNTRPQRHE